MTRCLQGRGGSTGYDNAVALPARADSEELAKENNKSYKPLKGSAVFSVAKVRRWREGRPLDVEKAQTDRPCVPVTGLYGVSRRAQRTCPVHGAEPKSGACMLTFLHPPARPRL